MTLSHNGIVKKYAMFDAAGEGRARKQMHDIVTKIRATGLTGPGKRRMDLAKIEAQDEAGEWKIVP